MQGNISSSYILSTINKFTFPTASYQLLTFVKVGDKVLAINLKK